MSRTSESIVIGLSGGVDSAVSALLLKREGFDVSAAFMKNWDEDDGTEYCSAEVDFEDAQRVADRLNIPLQSINFAAEYWDRVFERFLVEYQHNRTPNPDVLCNREIKFDLFLEFAKRKGIPRIATGHYARRIALDGRFGLGRACDRSKDQSYFLHAVPRDQLAACEFPLGGMLKSDVRELARSEGLHVYDKKDSTGICFIGERRFSDFLGRFVDRTPGNIVNELGRVVGGHNGLAFYTLGQRSGLRIGGRADAREAPWYVLDKNPTTNELVVTQDEERLYGAELDAVDPNWLIDEPIAEGTGQAMIRYRQSPEPCTWSVKGESVHVSFTHPQRSITPGQYVVFYKDELCLGGAKIVGAGS